MYIFFIAFIFVFFIAAYHLGTIKNQYFDNHHFNLNFCQVTVTSEKIFCRIKF